MKFSIKAQKIADRSMPVPTLPQPKPAVSSGRWVVLAGCMLLACAGTWAIMEFVVWNNLPTDLVGKWVVMGGEQDGATFDFYRSGRLVAHLNFQGQERILDAHVLIDADKMYLTTKHPHTGQVDTKMHTIKMLTSSRLVLQDERKNTYNMERAN